jgi:hypothetical protein
MTCLINVNIERLASASRCHSSYGSACIGNQYEINHPSEMPNNGDQLWVVNIQRNMGPYLQCRDPAKAAETWYRQCIATIGNFTSPDWKPEIEEVFRCTGNDMSARFMKVQSLEITATQPSYDACATVHGFNPAVTRSSKASLSSTS